MLLRVCSSVQRTTVCVWNLVGTSRTVDSGRMLHSKHYMSCLLWRTVRCPDSRGRWQYPVALANACRRRRRRRTLQYPVRLRLLCPCNRTLCAAAEKDVTVPASSAFSLSGQTASLASGQENQMCQTTTHLASQIILCMACHQEDRPQGTRHSTRSRQYRTWASAV